jgi:anaerobic ribonucleoside-triphosphate reductase activating protein
MNYAEIKYCDIANGEGIRTTLFVSGCTHHCRGCFQPETWDFGYGKHFDGVVAETIIESLKPAHVDGLTLLGGEPMEPDNQAVLAGFLELVKSTYPEKTVWCYTGDVLEDLLPGGPRHTEHTDRMLDSIDVLVDGPFVEDRKDITLRFRGSSNQRIIDLGATRSTGVIVPWEDDPMFSTHTM